MVVYTHGFRCWGPFSCTLILGVNYPTTHSQFHLILAANIISKGIVSSYGSYQTYYEKSVLSTRSSFQVSSIGAVQSFFMVFLGLLAGPIFDRGYFKRLLRVGSLLIVLGIVTQGLSTQYWQLILSQGVCVGVGMGCLAVPSLAVPSGWFTTKLPLANGVIVSASGFGG